MVYTRIRLLRLLIRSFIFLYFFFQKLKFSSHFSQELWGLESWNLMLLLICPFISSFFFLSNCQHWNFSSPISQELWGLEGWKFVHSWTVGRCIMYTRIRLHMSLYFFIFLSLQFSTLKFFITLFSGTVRPRRLKLGTHIDSGQMYHVYQNQAAAAYSSLYFFIFLSLKFSTLKFLVTFFSGTVRPRRLKLGTHVDSGQMYHIYQNQASAAYSSLYFFIFLSLQFSTFEFFVTLFSGTMRPRRLKIGALVDSGQMYHVYQIQAAASYSSLYFFIFLSLQLSDIKIFITLFSGTVRPRRLKLSTNVDSELMYRLYRNQVSAAYSSHYFIIFLSVQLSNIKNFHHIFLRNLWGLEDWNLVHMWIVGRCIVYTGIRLLLICPFISSFFFLSNFQTLKFLAHFYQELWGLEHWN